MSLLKDILLQLFFLIVPLLFFYSFVHRRYSKSSDFFRQVAVFFCCSTSILLCTQYPLQNIHGIIYFSSIPLVIVILYGGILARTLTFLTLLVYFIISPVTTLEMVIYTTIPVLPTFLHFFLKKWEVYSLLSKQSIFAFIACSGGILYSLSNLLIPYNGDITSSWSNYFPFNFWSGILYIGASLLLFYIIEYLCGINKLQQNFKKMKKLYHINIMAEEASKEFHKPLTMAKGFTQLLGAEKNQANKEYVPIILQELNRAERVIDSYLKLAKTEMFPFRAISSKELLQDVLKGIKVYATNHNIHIFIEKMRNLRIKGNMDMLTESMTIILKHCIDSNGGAINKIQLNHFLRRNDVVFEISLNSKRAEREPIKSFLHLPALLEDEGNSTLYTAYTILLAHGGDLQIKSRMFKKVVVITLPAQLKKSEYPSRKVIRTN